MAECSETQDSELKNFKEAMKLFTQGFPLPFRSSTYQDFERFDKNRIIDEAQKTFPPGKMEELYNQQHYAELGEQLKILFCTAEITSEIEMTRFKDFILDPENCKNFSRHLIDVLYGSNFDQAFEKFSTFLNENKEIRSWPTATYFQSIIKPDDHVFYKPSVAKHCAELFGRDIHYSSAISLRNYMAFKQLADDLLKKLRPYGARDYIDVHCFIYAIGKEGYIDGAKEFRRTFSMREMEKLKVISRKYLDQYYQKIMGIKNFD